jgi:hypothetical protein
MKLWALRLGLLLLAFPALLFLGLLLTPWLGYFLLPAVFILFVAIERRLERWLPQEWLTK